MTVPAARERRGTGCAVGLLAALVLVASAGAVLADDRAELRRLRLERLAADRGCEPALAEIPADERDAPLLALRGRCLLELQRFAEAADTLGRAVALDPELRDVALPLAVARYHAGDLVGAEAVLGEARRQGVQDEAQLELYSGLVLFERARSREAALAFERARRAGGQRVDPVASYYAGLAWQAEADDRRARAALQRVVELDPDGAWGRQAERALHMRGDRFRRPWVRLKAGLEYDSNVALLGDNLDPAVRSTVEGKDDGRGVWEAEVGAELFRRSGWSGGALASYAGNAHFDRSVYDTHYPGATLWLERDLDPATWLQLRYDFGYAWVDEDGYLETHGVRLSGLRDWGRSGRTELFVGGRFDDFLYDFDSSVPDAVQNDLDRDGDAVLTGFEHRAPLATDRLEARAGYIFEHRWTEGTEWQGDSHVWYAGLLWRLPWQVEADAVVRFLYEPYDKPSQFGNDASDDVSDNPNRLDKTWQTGLTLARPFGERWLLSLSYLYWDADSDRDVYDYDRHIVGAYATLYLP